MNKRNRWVHHLLVDWSDHWIRAARDAELQHPSHLYEHIKFAIAQRSGRQYMKMPSKNKVLKGRIPNLPIMSEWQRRVEVAVTDLSDAHQKVVFERYFGQVWGRFHRQEWAKSLGMTQDAFQGKLRRAHQNLEKKLEKRLQSDTFSVQSQEGA